tara:strand:+ start:10499 stop:10705 length:207 start_codon:yes stop_codon:yes gene_type:complete
MIDLKFNNGQIIKEINTIIEKGYTIKSGGVSGNSIEVLENNQSYVYYDNKVNRDSDLKKLKKVILDAQ